MSDSNINQIYSYYTQVYLQKYIRVYNLIVFLLYKDGLQFIKTTYTRALQYANDVYTEHNVVIIQVDNKTQWRHGT